MSNPGVITIASSVLDPRKSLFINRLDIEDNIGEAVHIHYRNIRFDFSVDDFLSLSRAVSDALTSLIDTEDINSSLISPDFLFDIRDHLPFLKSTEVIEKRLDDLECVVYRSGPGGPHGTKRIEDSPAFRYLEGDKHDFINYKQNGTITIGNETRLLDLLHSIKKNGYPYQDKYITLLGNSNIIRDGQHRAVILRHLFGNRTVKVLRLSFTEGYTRHIMKRRSSLTANLAWRLSSLKKRLVRLLP